MTRQRNKSPGNHKLVVDLTPMIDVVFLLIIFFLVVTQITTQDNVNLRLPDALAANIDEAQVQRPLVVHIAPVHEAPESALPRQFGYFCHGVAAPRSIQELEGILRQEADRVDEFVGLRGRGADGISENTVVVRCDARAPAQYFGRLIELMSQARIYKVKIQVLSDPEGV